MKTSLSAIAISIVVSVAATPAFANYLTSATVSANCTQYTISVQGKLLDTKTGTVRYTIKLTPTSGTPIIVKDTLTVTRTDNAGDFSGTATQNWSKYNLTLNTTYALTGTAHLNTSDGNTIAIVFTPTTLNCGVTGGGSCVPSSSLSVLTQGKTVTSYVPNGSWTGPFTGVQVVPVEPVGTPSSITTPNAVNSCSSNSVTGQTVCVANNTDVYLITGSTLNTTLTSGADAMASFSGGTCENCGVAFNTNTNTAVLTIGLKSSPSTSALQFLNLSSNTFATPVPATNEVSEDVLWDQTRNLILSPDEAGIYDLFQTSSTATTEYANKLAFGAGDSAAEDCSTGIALSSLEFTHQLYITDLTQAVFTPGPPATWTAPGQVQTFLEFSTFTSGTTGIAVAGGSHLGIVTGEFGGNKFAAFQLPATSGSGTPGLVDYAQAVLPNTPDGKVWNDGLDPHTITAYVSPNNNKAYGVMANSFHAPATYLALIDLQALLSAPRLTGTHTVDPTYNLLTSGVVTYIAVQ